MNILLNIIVNILVLIEWSCRFLAIMLIIEPRMVSIFYPILVKHMTSNLKSCLITYHSNIGVHSIVVLELGASTVVYQVLKHCLDESILRGKCWKKRFPNK